jgi:P pilus assembly chaperone PapD
MQSVKFLLCALAMALLLAVIAISMDHALKVVMEASGAIYNQYDKEVGTQ